MKLKIPYWPLLLGPISLLYLGSLMNWVVIGVNGGHMPVEGPLECGDSATKELKTVILQQEGHAPDEVHVCMDANSHLKVLADWLYFGEGVKSPGDVLMDGYDQFFFPGLYIWIALMVMRANKKEDEKCPVSSATKTSTFPRLMRSARRVRWSR